MNLTWLKDYGAFAAAAVAAVFAVATAVLQTRQSRRHEEAKWQREARLPRYAELLAAALQHREAIFGQLGEWDPHLLGPEPKSWPDPESAQARFHEALSAVRLLGPTSVATAASEVQFSLWHYRDQLEVDPFRWDQKPSSEAVAHFTAACRTALGMEAGPDEGSDSYRDWRRRRGLED